MREKVKGNERSRNSIHGFFYFKRAIERFETRVTLRLRFDAPLHPEMPVCAVRNIVASASAPHASSAARKPSGERTDLSLQSFRFFLPLPIMSGLSSVGITLFLQKRGCLGCLGTTDTLRTLLLLLLGALGSFLKTYRTWLR